jgi:hypothetical protein
MKPNNPKPEVSEVVGQEHSTLLVSSRPIPRPMGREERKTPLSDSGNGPVAADGGGVGGRGDGVD